MEIYKNIGGEFENKVFNHESFQNNTDNLTGKINTENKKFQSLNDALKKTLIELADKNQLIPLYSKAKDGIKKHTVKGDIIYIFKTLKHQKRVSFVMKNGKLELIACEDGGGKNTTDFLLNATLKQINTKNMKPQIPETIIQKETSNLEIINKIQDKIKTEEEREREIALEMVKSQTRKETLEEILTIFKK